MNPLGFTAFSKYLLPGGSRYFTGKPYPGGFLVFSESLLPDGSRPFGVMGADPVDGGRHHLQGGEKAQVCDALLQRFLYQKGVHGRRGLKAHGRENISMLRIRFCQLQRVHGGIDHPHAAALRARLAQAHAASGNAEHVAEGYDAVLRIHAQFDQPVNVGAHRHADRTAGAGNQLNGRRKQGRDPVSVNFRRMGAAHLHKTQGRAVIALQVLKDFHPP